MADSEAPEDRDPPSALEYVPVAASLEVPVAEPAREGYRFDAFDENTWRFRPPPPPPWYRTRAGMLGVTAVGAGLLTLVVSVSLLASRSDERPLPSRGSTPASAAESADSSGSSAPSVPTAAPEVTSAAAEPAPSSAPPPAAPPPEPAPQQTASAPRSNSSPTKKPEMNVTRAPMSVAPQQRGR